MSNEPRTDRNEVEVPIDQERVHRSRARIRQLTEALRNQVGSVLNQFAWEFNDQQTRRNVAESVGQVLDRTRREGNLQDFAVVCDETNNTSEDIDQGRMNCTIFVRPVRAAETVVVQVAIDPSQHRDMWGEPEIIRHEEEVKPALVKYFRKLNIPMED